MGARPPFQRAGQPALVVEGGHRYLAQPEQARAEDIPVTRKRAEEPAIEPAVLALETRQQIRCAALEHAQMRHNRCNTGHELDCAGAGADHGDLFATQVVVVFPLGGVKTVASEIVHTSDGGKRGRLSWPAPKITRSKPC